MPELRFTPRESSVWASAQVAESDEQSRTIGAAAHELQFDVPAAIAAAARKAQAEAFSNYSKGASELAINGVDNERLLRHLGRCEQLEPLFYWIAKQGLGELEPDGTWLMAHEVGFHSDPVHAYTGAFLVWQVAGPAKVLEFPQVGRGCHMEVGSVVLFDGAAPHGLRLPQFAGQPFQGAELVQAPPQSAEDITVYLSIDIPWTDMLRELLGIRTLPAGEYLEYEVEAATGHMTVVS